MQCPFATWIIAGAPSADSRPDHIVVDFHILVNWAGRSGGEHAASRGGGASLADWSGCCAGFGAGTSNDGNDSGGFGDGGRS